MYLPYYDFFWVFVTLSVHLCMYFNMTMSFVPDDWTNFIAFVLPEEVKVYNLFREKAS